MEKENSLERPLSEKSFEIARTVIEDSKKDKSATYPELLENLVNSFKGKTIQGPTEVILFCSVFLDARELVAVIKTLESDIPRKIAEEVEDKAAKGEPINPSLISAVLEAVMKKDW